MAGNQFLRGVTSDIQGQLNAIALQLELINSQLVTSTTWGGITGTLSNQLDLQAALNAKENLLGYTPENAANKGVAGGYASLDGTAKVPIAQIPAAVLTDTYVVASQAAMLALPANTGDVAIRTDINETFILQGADPTVLANWVELLFPMGIVANAPLSGTGTSADHLVISQASGASDGYLSSADWTTFNNAASSLTNYVLKAGDTMTGNLVLPTGTAAAPSLSFATGSGAGLYGYTNNAFHIALGGGLHYTISSSGIVLRNNASSFFLDPSLNRLLYFSATASAVNYLTIANAATLNGPTIGAATTGSDTNININLVPKGTGQVVHPSGGTSAPGITFSGLTNYGLTAASGYTAIVTNGIVTGQFYSGSLRIPGNIAHPQYGNPLLTFTNGNTVGNSNTQNINITNAVAGSSPVVSAVGTDTNIDLNLNAKGSGAVKFNSNVASISSTGAFSGSLANGVTATTQAASDNSTKVATTAYVDSAVMASSGVSAVGFGSFALNVSPTTSQTVAHGMGKTPKMVKFTYILGNVSSFGATDGTNNKCTFRNGSGAMQQDNTKCINLDNGAGAVTVSTATLDATNINLTHTFTGPGFGAVYVFWEAVA